MLALCQAYSVWLYPNHLNQTIHSYSLWKCKTAFPNLNIYIKEDRKELVHLSPCYWAFAFDLFNCLNSGGTSRNYKRFCYMYIANGSIRAIGNSSGCGPVAWIRSSAPHVHSTVPSYNRIPWRCQWTRAQVRTHLPTSTLSGLKSSFQGRSFFGRSTVIDRNKHFFFNKW